MTALTTHWFAHVGEGVEIFDPVVILNAHNLRIGDHTRIDSFVKIESGKGTWIGKHVHVASFCHLGIGGGELIVGDGVAFASGAKVLSGSNSIAGESMSAAAPKEQQVVEYFRTTIRENAFICTNAVVCPGATIGNHAVIAAGAVVLPGVKVPDYEVWGGVPAKFLKRVGVSEEARR